MIPERQSSRQAQHTRITAAAPLAAVLKANMPFDATRRGPGSGRSRGGVVLIQDVDRGKPPNGAAFCSSSSDCGGLFRVGRQTERRDQPGQCFFVRLVPLAERIDMIGRDAEQSGDAAQGVEPAHRVSSAEGIR